ncbi:ABC transporter substrate-binding protein [Nonomuraea sp. NPDC050663]|uniref:ABC transporter substrate-binding protein n=1 Tax=Nonomuraea sp. NPDC050663 TaxID=3364370 RepID=UPI0037968B2D
MKPAAATGLALLLLTAAACGTSGSSQNSTGGQITLKIWDFSMEQVEFHKKVTDQFTKEHPNIKVEWRSIAQAEYKTTLPLAFQSRQSPDIFYWSENGPLNSRILLNNGWIKPLHPSGTAPDEFIKRWPQGSFIEGVNLIDGKAHGFPFTDNLYWGGGYMFMHNDVFKQAGLDPASPPRTFSELKAACAKIRSATKAECITSPNKGADVMRLFDSFAGVVMNGSGFDLKSGRFSLDDPRILSTFNFIQELNKAGYIAPGTNDKNFSRQQFAAGQAAIYFDGTWMPSVWTSQGFASDKYSVAAQPLPDAGRTGAPGREPNLEKYFVSSQTKNHDAAWTFLDWMTKPDGFFVQEYYKGGFGTLSYADNKKMVTDPALRKIMEIAETPGFRVNIPVPLLKCPDLAKSKAYQSAISKRPDWAAEIITETLNNGGTLDAAAKELVTARQTALEEGLKAEAASGLKVSMDCYTFPDFDHVTDYGLDRY